ncbi:MAG: bifunctional precorrin-2 dehydrogenase/sirohydrochlorin ferrochelatase [Bacteroidetes bacterium]|nr:bifunctional precorrin-2 dehydrogenase/sirohydrochlorin ferrochelatase [Bacteroidota bacterium]
MTTQSNSNPLYPVFLKLHTLDLLIVGAGEVAHEKLFFILKNSPEANVTVVAPWVSPHIQVLLKAHPGHRVTFRPRDFEPTDVVGFQLVIAATNNRALNESVRDAAKNWGALVNVADTPERCDFYLGSVVTKGDLKIAISTNGKSPTFAKRFRQILEEALPDNTPNLLRQLHSLRTRLAGDFTQKVNRLNDLTASLVEQKN